MVALSLVALVVGAGGGNTASVQTEDTMVGAFIVGVIAVIGFGVYRLSAIARAESEATQRSDQIMRDSRRSQRSSALASIAGNDRAAVDSFQRMPIHLKAAAIQYRRADDTFADGAFSPFWSAIESAFASLAEYLREADRISGFSIARSDQARSMVGVTPFPISLDANRVAEQHAELLQKLDELVYEAQKDPIFATIWEQRRTTAAVISGFRNLETAIATMGSRLSGSLNDLGAALETSSQDVVKGVSELRSAVDDAARQQLASSRELTVRAIEIRDELYYPELSKWLH